MGACNVRRPRGDSNSCCVREKHASWASRRRGRESVMRRCRMRSPVRDSNSRPPLYESGALPTELPGHGDGLTGTLAAGWARTVCLSGGQRQRTTALGPPLSCCKRLRSARRPFGVRWSSTCLSRPGEPCGTARAEPPARTSSDCRARTCDDSVNSRVLYQLS